MASTFMLPTGSINQFRTELQKLHSQMGVVPQLEARLSALEKAVHELVQITFTSEAGENGDLTLQNKLDYIEQYDRLPTADRDAWYAQQGIKKGQIVAWKRLKTQGKLA